MLPQASTTATQAFVDGSSATLAPDVRAALVADGAGGRVRRALRAPDNVTLAPLPPRPPELSPVERLRLHLRERFLSHRRHADYAAVLDAACDAWNQLTPERLQSLASYPWLPQLSS